MFGVVKEGSRTLRSKLFRSYLWLWAGGKCQQCGVELPEDWHADHKKPWSLTHRTNLYEMQALCPACDSKKGNLVVGGECMNREERRRLAKIDPDYSKSRPGQRGAIITILNRLASGEQFTSIRLPTRYGKSDVIRAASIIAYFREITDHVVAISPLTGLQLQLVKDEKWKGTEARFGLSKGTRCRTIDGAPRSTADAFFTSITQQNLNHHKGAWVTWVQCVVAQTGKPPVFMVDEGHTNRANDWGKDIDAIAEAGARIVFFTATPEVDGDLPKGFRIKKLKEESTEYSVCRPGSTPEKIAVDIYAGRVIDFEVDADFSVTFGEAWQEEKLPMCHLQKFDVEVDLSKIDGGTSEPLKLSEASQELAKKLLSKVIRDPKVIGECCRKLVAWLKELKRHNPLACGIVFCGNDKDGDDDNAHAEAVKASILMEAPHLRVKIVTMSASDDGAKELDAFAGQFEDETDEVLRYPDADILIVKQMGGLGFDFKALKVALDLSSNRTWRSCVQRWMRPGTLWSGFTRAVLISLSDCIAEAIYQRLTKDCGQSKMTEAELVRSYEVDRKEKLKPIYHVEGARDGEYKDSMGGILDPDQAEEVQAFVAQYPGLLAIYSYPEIHKMLRDMGGNPFPVNGRAAPTQKEAPSNIDGRKDQLRQECNKLVGEIREKWFSVPNDAEIHMSVGEKIQIVWGIARQRSSLPKAKDVPLGKLDLEELARLQVQLEAMLKTAKEQYL